MTVSQKTMTSITIPTSPTTAIIDLTTRSRGRRFATSLALGVTLIAASGCTSSDETKRNDDGEVVEGGDVGSGALQVGDCLAEEAVGEIQSVPVVPCSDVHDTELFHSFDLVGDDFPGVEAIQEAVADECLPAFEEFIGVAYADSAWDISTIAPTQETWDAIDDREVLCGVFPLTDEDTTGSAKGIAQ